MPGIILPPPGQQSRGQYTILPPEEDPTATPPTDRAGYGVLAPGEDIQWFRAQSASGEILPRDEFRAVWEHNRALSLGEKAKVAGGAALQGAQGAAAGVADWARNVATGYRDTRDIDPDMERAKPLGIMDLTPIGALGRVLELTGKIGGDRTIAGTGEAAANIGTETAASILDGGTKAIASLEMLRRQVAGGIDRWNDWDNFDEAYENYVDAQKARQVMLGKKSIGLTGIGEGYGSPSSQLAAELGLAPTSEQAAELVSQEVSGPVSLGAEMVVPAGAVSAVSKLGRVAAGAAGTASSARLASLAQAARATAAVPGGAIRRMGTATVSGAAGAAGKLADVTGRLAANRAVQIGGGALAGGATGIISASSPEDVGRALAGGVIGGFAGLPSGRAIARGAGRVAQDADLVKVWMQTKNATPGALRALDKVARNPSNPVWMRQRAATWSKYGGDRALSTAAGAVVGAASEMTEEAITGALAGMSPEELGENIGGGAVFGAAVGSAQRIGIDRAVQKIGLENDIVAMAASQDARGGSSEAFASLDYDDQATLAMLQEHAGELLDIRVLTGDQWRQRGFAPGGSGVHDAQRNSRSSVIYLNADAIRDPVKTILHEFGHDIAKRLSPQQFDRFQETARGLYDATTRERMAATYAQRLGVDRLDPDGSDFYHELFAEQFLLSADGWGNLKSPLQMQDALRAKAGVLERLGLLRPSGISDQFDVVLQSNPVMAKMMREFGRQYEDYTTAQRNWEDDLAENLGQIDRTMQTLFRESDSAILGDDTDEVGYRNVGPPPTKPGQKQRRETSGRQMPPRFYRSRDIDETLKTAAKAVEGVFSEGQAMRFRYTDATGKVTDREAVPVKFVVPGTGVLSVQALDTTKVNGMLAAKPALLKPWDGDPMAFWRDAARYRTAGLTPEKRKVLASIKRQSGARGPWNTLHVGKMEGIELAGHNGDIFTDAGPVGDPAHVAAGFDSPSAFAAAQKEANAWIRDRRKQYMDALSIDRPAPAVASYQGRPVDGPMDGARIAAEIMAALKAGGTPAKDIPRVAASRIKGRLRGRRIDDARREQAIAAVQRIDPADLDILQADTITRNASKASAATVITEGGQTIEDIGNAVAATQERRAGERQRRKGMTPGVERSGAYERDLRETLVAAGMAPDDVANLSRPELTDAIREQGAQIPEKWRSWSRAQRRAQEFALEDAGVPREQIRNLSDVELAAQITSRGVQVRYSADDLTPDNVVSAYEDGIAAQDEALAAQSRARYSTDIDESSRRRYYTDHGITTSDAPIIEEEQGVFDFASDSLPYAKGEDPSGEQSLRESSPAQTVTAIQEQFARWARSPDVASDEARAMVAQLESDPRPVTAWLRDLFTHDQTWNPVGSIVDNPEDAFAANALLRNPLFESLRVMVLDDDGRVVHAEITGVGYLNESIAAPRDVIRALTAANATAPDGTRYRRVVISHNHPSGDPRPSEADRAITHAIRKTMEAIDAELADHVITNGREGYSFTTGEVFRMPEDFEVPWAIGGRDTKAIDMPDAAQEVAASLRAHNDTLNYAILLNTKHQIVGVQALPNEAGPAAASLAQGMAEIGAFTSIISMRPTADPTDIEFRVYARVVAKALAEARMKAPLDWVVHFDPSKSGGENPEWASLSEYGMMPSEVFEPGDARYSADITQRDIRNARGSGVIDQTEKARRTLMRADESGRLPAIRKARAALRKEQSPPFLGSRPPLSDTDNPIPPGEPGHSNMRRLGPYMTAAQQQAYAEDPSLFELAYAAAEENPHLFDGVRDFLVAEQIDYPDGG